MFVRLIKDIVVLDAFPARDLAYYKNVYSLQATAFLLTWSESYILALILQLGLSSQTSLYFINQGINRL